MRAIGAVILPWLALGAAGQTTSPTVWQLRDAFVESVSDDQKEAVLRQISAAKPETSRDVQALFDLFTRFADAAVRGAALNSLEKLSSPNPSLEPLFIHYLQEPEPEAVLFGIKGALKLRATQALPLVEKIARRRFSHPSPQGASLLSEKNAWWTQYEALAALAQWQGEKAWPLFERKVKEVPAVARLMAMYFWEKALDQFERWARSSSAEDQERARQALAAPVALEPLRAARKTMMGILRNPRAARELRHQIALKIGLSSNEGEIAALLEEYQALKDPSSRLMFTAALFASRSPLVIPLLTDHAKSHSDSQVRAGALVQLKDMLSAEDWRPLAEWTAQNDPDPENRETAKQDLSALK